MPRPIIASTDLTVGDISTDTARPALRHFIKLTGFCITLMGAGHRGAHGGAPVDTVDQRTGVAVGRPSAAPVLHLSKGTRSTRATAPAVLEIDGHFHSGNALMMHTSINAWLNIIPVLPTEENAESTRPLSLMVGLQVFIAAGLLLQASRHWAVRGRGAR